jgi:hypothetical protein
MPPLTLEPADAPNRIDRLESSKSGIPLAFFFLALCLPISWSIGSLALDPIRLYLLITIVPFMAKLLSKQAGPIVMSDYLIAAFSLWIVVTLTARHGIERFPYGAILAIESFGGYLAGRMIIRSSVDYKKFIDFYIIALVIMLPFAVYELYVGRMPIADMFRGIFTVLGKNPSERYDLSRVQVVFPHSILFGFFCSLTIASIFHIYKDRISSFAPRLALVTSMAFMSLSSGPLISVALQYCMVSWGVVTRNKWKLLLVIMILLYIAGKLFTNRGPILIFIETFTFDPRSGWWRLHIWNFGSASVLNHPFLGIGLDIYEKPAWLTDSVDNFWLLMAMRHGFPGFLLLAAAFAFHIRFIVKVKGLDPLGERVRTGYMITLVGMIFTLATVHVWGAISVLVMFFLGAGSFIYTQPPNLQRASSTHEVEPRFSRGHLPLTRYQNTPTNVGRRYARAKHGASKET